MTAAVQHRDAALLLAMAPALAMSETVVSSIGMSALILVAALLTAGMFVIVRRFLAPEAQLPGALLLFAGVVACSEVLMRAFFYDLHGELDVFVPLAIANVVIVGALISSDETDSRMLVDVAKISLAMALILLVLGVGRELVGRGSLLHDAGLMLGLWARTLETKVFRVDMGFLLGMLPPGAFISLGLLLAFHNWWMTGRRAAGKETMA